MKLLPTEIPEVIEILPIVRRDDRGYFLETWKQSAYAAAGLPAFSQDNISWSARGVLRGMHFQWPHPQAKLVTVLVGRVLDVAADIRVGSPTFGKIVSRELSADDHRQFYIPAGFAHGFVVLSENALFAYKCSCEYVPAADSGFRWNDSELAIPWPTQTPRVSPKDAALPSLKDLLNANRLPTWIDSSVQRTAVQSRSSAP